MFTKYGYTTIGVVAVITLLLITSSFFVQNNPLKLTILLVAAIILFLTLNFFRDPDRKTPDENGIIVSPADGKIIVVAGKYYKLICWRKLQSDFNIYVSTKCSRK